VVVLDKSVFRYPDRAGAPEYVPVLRHELGHLVGLGHVDDATQLMSPTIGEPQTFQSGDLAGLAKLGQGTCAPGL
jgi:predicted Zn-dependent protease